MVRILVNAGGRPEIPVDVLERGIRAALDAEGAVEGEISLTPVDDAEIREMNRRYLDRDRPTDVIAFRLHEDAGPVLGDVYLGLEVARRQAAERGIPLREELLRLAIHGALHVLGHEHPEGPERESSPMFRLQEALVERVLGRRGAGPSGPERSGSAGTSEGPRDSEEEE